MLDTLTALVTAHGYWLVAAVVALESMGLPLPGETVLVIAAVYSGKTHDLDITLVIAAAAAGAIVGDMIGFAVGRYFGYRLLLRIGPHLHITTTHIKLAQFLFLRHGGAVVFFGRFLAVLRTLAALLAGVNGMEWRRFAVFNATGGVVWATSFGLGAYWLGEQVDAVAGPLKIVALAAVVLGGVAAMIFVRRHQSALEAAAERALPGPLHPPPRMRHRHEPHV